MLRDEEIKIKTEQLTYKEMIRSEVETTQYIMS
jgi:hypothetical protein